MAQITTGIRSVLSSPLVYDTLQNIMGARKVRAELVSDFIRPRDEDNILDVGCGTGDILSYLPKTIHYWGYDISQVYIDSAKKKFSGRGNFQCGLLDVDTLSLLPKFDLVLAIGVLHHLGDEDARNFFSLSYQALKQGGRVVTLDPCFVEDQNLIAHYLIANDRGLNVRNVDGYCALTQGGFVDVEGIVRHRRWLPYTHCIMECKK